MFLSERELAWHFREPLDAWRHLAEKCDLAGYVRYFRQPPPGFFHLGAVYDWLQEVVAGRWPVPSRACDGSDR